MYAKNKFQGVSGEKMLTQFTRGSRRTMSDVFNGNAALIDVAPEKMPGNDVAAARLAGTARRCAERDEARQITGTADSSSKVPVTVDVEPPRPVKVRLVSIAVAVMAAAITTHMVDTWSVDRVPASRVAATEIVNPEVGVVGAPTGAVRRTASDLAGVELIRPQLDEIQKSLDLVAAKVKSFEAGSNVQSPREQELLNLQWEAFGSKVHELQTVAMQVRGDLESCTLSLRTCDNILGSIAAKGSNAELQLARTAGMTALFDTAPAPAVPTH